MGRLESPAEADTREVATLVAQARSQYPLDRCCARGAQAQPVVLEAYPSCMSSQLRPGAPRLPGLRAGRRCVGRSGVLVMPNDGRRRPSFLIGNRTDASLREDGGLELKPRCKSERGRQARPARCAAAAGGRSLSRRCYGLEQPLGADEPADTTRSRRARTVFPAVARDGRVMPPPLPKSGRDESSRKRTQVVRLPARCRRRQVELAENGDVRPVRWRHRGPSSEAGQSETPVRARWIDRSRAPATAARSPRSLARKLALRCVSQRGTPRPAVPTPSRGAPVMVQAARSMEEGASATTNLRAPRSRRRLQR
jgi:hypothetical protein